MSEREVLGERTHASARARVHMEASTALAVSSNELKKGDVLATARFAGIQAAKNAAAMLPMSSLGAVIDEVTVSFVVGETQIDIETQVSARDGLPVRTHALAAASAAALTIYDMCKAVDRTMSIRDLEVTINPTRPDTSR